MQDKRGIKVKGIQDKRGSRSLGLQDKRESITHMNTGVDHKVV